jgi:hypothetical protein
MSASGVKAAFALFLILPRLAVGQTPSSPTLHIERALIERIAIEAAVHRAGLTSGGPLRIVIDPMMVFPNEAPGYRKYASRDSLRQDHLLRVFGASSRRSMELIDCKEAPCLRDIDVLVTLSDPHVDRDSASVTVTTQRYLGDELPRLRRRQYITTTFILQKESGQWRIARIVDLGVS